MQIYDCESIQKDYKTKKTYNDAVALWRGQRRGTVPSDGLGGGESKERKGVDVASSYSCLSQRHKLKE